MLNKALRTQDIISNGNQSINFLNPFCFC
jgi:hypothetical protein